MHGYSEVHGVYTGSERFVGFAFFAGFEFSRVHGVQRGFKSLRGLAKVYRGSWSLQEVQRGPEKFLEV